MDWTNRIEQEQSSWGSSRDDSIEVQCDYEYCLRWSVTTAVIAEDMHCFSWALQLLHPEFICCFYVHVVGGGDYLYYWLLNRFFDTHLPLLL